MRFPKKPIKIKKVTEDFNNIDSNTNTEKTSQTDKAENIKNAVSNATK